MPWNGRWMEKLTSNWFAGGFVVPTHRPYTTYVCVCMYGVVVCVVCVASVTILLMQLNFNESAFISFFSCTENWIIADTVRDWEREKEGEGDWESAREWKRKRERETTQLQDLLRFSISIERGELANWKVAMNKNKMKMKTENEAKLSQEEVGKNFCSYTLIPCRKV